MIVVGEFEMILRTSAVLAISGERKPEDREDTGLNGAYNRVFKSAEDEQQRSRTHWVGVVL